MTVDDRTHQYGITVDDPEKIPRGPYFIKQPQDVVFDVSNVKVTNDVTLRYFTFLYIFFYLFILI